MVIPASADTYVDSAAPATVFGTQTTISADASPTRYVFLRFDLTAVTGTISAATLRLHTRDTADAASPAGGTVRRITGNAWSRIRHDLQQSPFDERHDGRFVRLRRPQCLVPGRTRRPRSRRAAS